MLIQKKINKWGCLPTAFAMVFNVPVQDLYTFLGHDGGEILDEQPDPFCRRGIHSQEIIDYALANNYAVTRIDCFPTLQRPDCELAILSDEQADRRVLKWMGKSSGVITGIIGSNTFHRHALVNCRGLIYDPDTGKQLSKLPHNCIYESYYKVDPL